ncbi:MAG: Druantia anti-phage system protein DruA [Acidiferrobacteraceae bacterium]
MQFSSPAWRLHQRDQWIGWDDATRARCLQQILCNSRFLILPHVRVPNLASHVLALALHTVLSDWTAAYGVQPLLAETLVDPARFTGHCYRAANWIDVGLTAGRGREDRQHLRHGVSPKRIWLYPLVPDARQRLLQAGPPRQGRKILISIPLSFGPELARMRQTQPIQA